MEKKIFNYGFDIDDVVCDFIPLLIRSYNNKHNTNFDVNDIDTFGFYVYGEKRIEWNELKKIIIEESLYKKVPVITRTKEIINELIKKKQRVYLITAREEEHKQETIEWLNENGINFTKLILTKEPKDKLCNSLNIKSFVDDKLETILNISKNCPNTKPILQVRPWNGTREANQLIKEGKFKDLSEINKLLKRVRIVV